MSGRHSRRKGAETERRLVRLLQEHGFAAEKISRSGYTGCDITVPLLGQDRRAEVKVRAHGFSQIYGWLGENDFLIVRADRSKLLVVLPFDLAVEIAQAAEQTRVPR
jgi:Holliday junction resolvase